MNRHSFIAFPLLLLSAWSQPALAQHTPWTLTTEGLYGEMNFAPDQSGALLELRYESEKRRSAWGRYQRLRKFEQNADGFVLGAAAPIPVRRSAAALEVGVAPNQTIAPESYVDVSFINDPTGWLEAVMRYRYSHYTETDIHLMNPTLIWMPHERIQWSAGYFFTETKFLGPGITLPDHSWSTRLLVRPCAWLHPWLAYSHSQESFEAGNSAFGAFQAHHYIGGFILRVWKDVELRSSFELEERDNHQILRTGTVGVAIRW